MPEQLVTIWFFHNLKGPAKGGILKSKLRKNRLIRTIREARSAESLNILPEQLKKSVNANWREEWPVNR